MAGAGDADPDLPIGARLSVSGHRATVRFAGPVDGQAGEWVGLEWDDPSRGKHDGSHAGRRYFSCAGGGAAGSLVRRPKLLGSADLGCSVLEAVHRRYSRPGAAAASPGSSSRGPAPGDPASGGPAAAGAGDDGEGEKGGEGEEDPTPASELYVPTASNRRVAVQLVGAAAAAARAAQLGRLQAASLAGLNVSRVGDLGDVAAALPALTELDLSDCLLPRWGPLEELAVALPSLLALNLSGSRLALPPAAPLTLPPPALPAANLQILVLNGCGVAWPEAVAAAARLPALRELHLAGNGISSLLLPGAAGLPGAAAALAAALPSLEHLDLESNALGAWADAAPLAALPRLAALLLGDNPLSDDGDEGDGDDGSGAVSGAWPGSGGGAFPSLRRLLLGGCAGVRHWATVDRLSRLPSLAELRVSGTGLAPAAGGGGGTASGALSGPDTAAAAAAALAVRYGVIARLPGLAAVNASEVRPPERREAELVYLREVTDALAGAGPDAGARQRVLAQHPRFAALDARYGPLAPAPGPAGGAGAALSRGMAAVTLAHGGREVTKKLPLSLTVAKLKLLVEKLLGVPAPRQALLLRQAGAGAAGASPGEDITGEEGRELRHFSPGDGCRVEVEEFDPGERAAAAAGARSSQSSAQEQRLEAAERALQGLRSEQERVMAGAGR